MSDIVQHGLITTLHDLRTVNLAHLEDLLRQSTRNAKIGLVLPVTAADMRAEPFRNIVKHLEAADYIERIVVVLGMAPSVDDYRETKGIVDALGPRAQVLWTDGQRTEKLYQALIDAGFNLAIPGKGRAVWTAFGYLLSDPSLRAYALHDCDIVTYDREMLARLCLPMVHPSLDFQFCKAYYARVTDRMHGRVVRLLVTPLLSALVSVLGSDPFLIYMSSFRYPLAGEFAMSASLAQSNRIPSDWGLEVGTLAEVFRNTSLKRVCQVDLARPYEHKHQAVSLDDASKGLMRMATDILTTLFRTLASRGTIFSSGHFMTLRAAYLRAAQDAIRQYNADAIMNGLEFGRHEEEITVEGFAQQILAAAEAFEQNPLGGEAIPNWARVRAAFPEFPQQLKNAADEDAQEFGY